MKLVVTRYRHGESDQFEKVDIKLASLLKLVRERLTIRFTTGSQKLPQLKLIAIHLESQLLHLNSVLELPNRDQCIICILINTRSFLHKQLN